MVVQILTFWNKWDLAVAHLTPKVDPRTVLTYNFMGLTGWRDFQNKLLG